MKSKNLLICLVAVMICGGTEVFAMKKKKPKTLLFNTWKAAGRLCMDRDDNEGFKKLVEKIPAENLENFINKGEKTTGKTLLIYAASLGRINIVNYLLTIKEIDVDIQDNGGYTALIWAAFNGHSNVVEVLCAKNVNAHVNVKSKEGWTALMKAIQADKLNIAVIKTLLERDDLNVDEQADHDRPWTALMMAVDQIGPVTQSNIPQISEVIQLLLARGANHHFEVMEELTKKSISAYKIAQEKSFDKIVKIFDDFEKAKEVGTEKLAGELGGLSKSLNTLNGALEAIK